MRPTLTAIVMAGILLAACENSPITRAQDLGPPPPELASFFQPPEQFRNDFGSYRSPLKFADGSMAKSAKDWPRRRAEILQTWHGAMGRWPALIEKPQVETVQVTRRDNVTQQQLRLGIALGGEMVDAFLLIPDGKGPFPAVVVVYYDAQTGVGLGTKNRDYGWHLAKRGFIVLSLGRPSASVNLKDSNKAKGGSYLGPAGKAVRVQPLSALAYLAANAHAFLAQRADVIAARIGIVGHSFGGKWSLFASCLHDGYACAVWSDPGIVFDERNRRKENPGGSVNYWDVWYLGFPRGQIADPKNPGPFRKLPSEGQERTGAYKELVEAGHDLVELQALMAPRPFLVSGGTADMPERWAALNHTIAVNRLLGFENRVAMTNRKEHGPSEKDNEQVYQFFEWCLKKPADPNQARTPRQVAEQLAAVYGHKLNQVAYIPALPLVAKLRLSELTRQPKYAEEVHALAAPFLRGEKSPIPKSGSEQAGHLIFAELASHAKGKDRERWIQLCRNAADQIFGKGGKSLPIMPFHSEMSDAVFMAGPILAATGKLTGDKRYFDAAATHFASMRKLCLRKDGIYRHSPLCEAAWGRGNGFPALGLALALSDWPEDHPARKELLAEFQKHLAALKPHQDAKTGCWHQVIDHPESYDEYSCTCMIGFAMQRGIQRGWLAKEDYQPSVDRAWRAIKERTSTDGKLVNVCAGTGKQKTIRDYFNRPAINGRDDRGGAMGLLFATELLASEKGDRK